MKYLKRLFTREVIIFNGVTIAIYEQITNATFFEMLGGLGEQRRRWKDKEEVLTFSKQNKDKLGPNGNFFEMEGGLVADVNAGGPYVSSVYGLSCGHIWDAEYEHRFFSSQQ